MAPGRAAWAAIKALIDSSEMNTLRRFQQLPSPT
jgi:hypothetical protein